MKLIFKKPYKSFTTSPSDEEMANFIILSGPNGSGKSSLLESIATGAIEIEGFPYSRDNPNQIKLFTLSQFVISEEGAQGVTSYGGSWINLKNQVTSHVNTLRGQYGNVEPTPQELQSYVRLQLTQGGVITVPKLEEAESSAGKNIIEFSDADYRNHVARIYGPRNAFELSLNEIFLSYHAKQDFNNYRQYLTAEKGRTDLSPLSDEEFIKKYGPAPWDLFDATLNLVGLGNYKFVPPSGLEAESTYLPILTDSLNPRVPHVSVNDLSSGEKTLLRVAMTLYTGSNHEEDVTMPKVLLLDEADASLHPSMIVKLLEVVESIVVDKLNIRVILTTHSPTTLALAPEDALYTMTKDGNPRMVKAKSRDEALKIVTVGLPTLSVKIDNRIQVFTEAEEDARCYDAMYGILVSKIGGEKSLNFIASGKGGSGDVNAVKHLVSKLNGAGNDTIKGLIDRDDRNSAPANIYFNSERYSLENAVLDPLAVGVFLLRERIVKPEGMGLPNTTTHLDATQHAQKIINFIISKLEEDTDDKTQVLIKYDSELACNVPAWVLNMNGHNLQTRYVNKFGALAPFDRDKTLLFRVIDRGMRDVPAVIPASIVDVFKKMMTD